MPQPPSTRRVRHAASVILALASLTQSLPAQQRASSAVRPGAQVRVEAPTLGAGRSMWEVAGVRGDTLRLRRPEDSYRRSVAVPLASVTRLEVNRGPLRNSLVGAALGLALGAAGGRLYGANRPGLFNCVGQIFGCTEEQRRDPDPGGYAVLGGTFGIPIGAVVGGLVIGDRWERLIPGPGARPRVGLVPYAPGAGAGLAVTVALPDGA